MAADLLVEFLSRQPALRWELARVTSLQYGDDTPPPDVPPPPPAPMPEALVEGNATLVGTTVYLNGGETAATGGNSVQPYRMLAFHTVENYWSTLTPFATGTVDKTDYRSQYYDQLITINGLIYSIQAYGYGHVHLYNPITDAWTTLVSWDQNFANKPAGWEHLFWSGTATEPGDYGTRVTGGGGNMYVWGYRHLTPGVGESSIPGLWAWNPAGDTWTQLANAPVLLEGLGVVAAGKLYVFDRDLSVSNSTYRIYAYDITANTWTTPAGGIFPYLSNVNHLVALGTTIYLVGTNQVTAYDTLTDTWSVVPGAIPGQRLGNVPAAVGSDLYIFGGQSSTTYFSDVLTPLRTPPPLDVSSTATGRPVDITVSMNGGDVPNVSVLSTYADSVAVGDLAACLLYGPNGIVAIGAIVPRTKDEQPNSPYTTVTPNAYASWTYPTPERQTGFWTLDEVVQASGRVGAFFYTQSDFTFLVGKTISSIEIELLSDTDTSPVLQVHGNVAPTNPYQPVSNELGTTSIKANTPTWISLPIGVAEYLRDPAIVTGGLALSVSNYTVPSAIFLQHGSLRITTLSDAP